MGSNSCSSLLLTAVKITLRDLLSIHRDRNMSYSTLQIVIDMNNVATLASNVGVTHESKNDSLEQKVNLDLAKMNFYIMCLQHAMFIWLKPVAGNNIDTDKEIIVIHEGG